MAKWCCPSTVMYVLLSSINLGTAVSGFTVGLSSKSGSVTPLLQRQHHQQHGWRRRDRSIITTTTKYTATTASSLHGEPPPPSASTADVAQPMPWILNTKQYGEFQQDRDWGFAYSSTPPEACSTYAIDTVEGQVPTDLSGIYYKAGPGNFEREGRRYEHVLDRDGFIASLTFDNGSVRYTGRFVETEFYLDELKDNKIKYRNVFGTQRTGGFLTNAFDLCLKNVANTNVLEWGGRVFALWEAGRPYELDPITLETLAPTQDGPFCDLGAADARLRSVTIDEGGPIDQLVKVGRSFTAHPHIVDDDTMIAFKSVVKAKTNEAVLEFIEYDKHWNHKKSTEFSFQNGPPPHDFSVSENFFCFFQNPFGEMDNAQYILGLKAPTQIMQLMLRRPTILNIVVRDGSDGSFQVEVPPYFNIHHVAKSEEKDGKLYVYSNGWDLEDERFFPSSKDSVPFLGSWGGSYPDFVGGIVPPSLLFRTVVDLKSQTVVEHKEVVPGAVIEFPSQDERNTDIVYLSAATTDYTSLPGNGFCKMNLAKGTAQYWWADHLMFANDIIPVAKRNGDPGSWLLALMYDAGEKRATMVILDSEKFEAGPVCRLHLKHHLTYGLHSSFSASI